VPAFIVPAFFLSLVIALVTVAAGMFIAVLARFRFVGKNTLMLVFLATQMFPAVLLIPPLLSQWYALGLIDTYQALDLRIKGILRTEDPQIDWYSVVIPLDLGQSSLDLKQGVTEIDIKLKDINQVDLFNPGEIDDAKCVGGRAHTFCFHVIPEGGLYIDQEIQKPLPRGSGSIDIVVQLAVSPCCR
jgi:hypothetical protein